MFTSALILGFSLIGPSIVEAAINVTVVQPTAFTVAATMQNVTNVLSLSRKKSSSGYNARSAAHLLGMSKGNYSTSLISLFLGEEFATEIIFGTETFEAIVDTGSSDTWLVETGFQCVDVVTSAPETEDYCAFGPTYNVTDTFSKIPNENFNITYGDGEFLTGIVGYEKVSLAGLTVNQTISVVNYAAWYGDSTTSGLIGLAYPALTSAYNGTDPTKDGTATGQQIEYSSIFKTMYTDGLIAPLFSLAILRDISGPAGYLTLGGLPPISFVPDFTSTPILITKITGYPTTYDFYTINIGSVVLNGHSVSKSGGKKIQYIVDSGTTLNYFPTAVADSINAAFKPPAVYDSNEGAYVVSCNATAPSLAIKINGKKFYTNPLDMILLAGTDENGNNVCITGIDDGGSSLTDDVFILGDTFQKNVVAVFDVGAGEMRFAAREFYDSNDPVKV